METETHMTTDTENLPAVDSDWGSEGASRQDILVPRLQLMQDISEAVKKGKHKAGDIIDSVTGTKLGDEEVPVEIIPFTTFREWYVMEVNERGKDKFKSKVLMTPENENWPYETVDNGTPIRNVRVINFFVMVPGQMEGLPFLVSFKKTSILPGKQLSTHFQMSAMKHVTPAKQIFRLGATERSWEDNTFKVFTIELGRATTPEELGTTRKWYETLKTQQVKTDEADDFTPESY